MFMSYDVPHVLIYIYLRYVCLVDRAVLLVRLDQLAQVLGPPRPRPPAAPAETAAAVAKHLAGLAPLWRGSE